MMHFLRTSCLYVLVVFLMFVSTAQANTQGDFAIPNGHFYTQTANGTGGFAVVDDAEARLWSEFQRLGGLQTVGYPISRRYVYDGFMTQAFQKLVLQWRPDVGQAWPVNVFDELSAGGFNERLFSTRQTPYPLANFDTPNASWDEIVAGRQGLLDERPAIHGHYFSVSDPLNVFGLPISRIEDMGNHYALRTQRAVFQEWKIQVPWALAGEVTIANGGDIAKEMGWLSGSVLEPEAVPGTTPTLGSFTRELKEVLITHRYPLIEQKMNNPFVIAYWESERGGFAPRDAISRLSPSYLSTNSSISFPDPQPDIRALLGGLAPEMFLDAHKQLAHVLFSQAWHGNEKTEALLFITQEADGRYVWDTLLLAPRGFQASSDTPPAINEDLLNVVDAALKEAIINRNYEVIKTLLRDPFHFDFWGSEGFTALPDEALAQLRTTYIGHNHWINFSDAEPDLNALLGGQDPQQLWGRDANVVVRVIHSDAGWGSDGQGEALLVIAINSLGDFYWHSVLIAPNGF